MRRGKRKQLRTGKNMQRVQLLHSSIIDLVQCPKDSDAPSHGCRGMSLPALAERWCVLCLGVLQYTAAAPTCIPYMYACVHGVHCCNRRRRHTLFCCMPAGQVHVHGSQPPKEAYGFHTKIFVNLMCNLSTKRQVSNVHRSEQVCIPFSWACQSIDRGAA